jgi:hypothetical protein
MRAFKLTSEDLRSAIALIAFVALACTIWAVTS